LLLAGLAGMGGAVEGDLGSSSPLEAMGTVLPIIGSTRSSWPPCRRVSRWLGADLPRQAERRFGLPVTTIITGYRPPGLSAAGYGRRPWMRAPR
jgi:hypothetical protein